MGVFVPNLMPKFESEEKGYVAKVVTIGFRPVSLVSGLRARTTAERDADGGGGVQVFFLRLIERDLQELQLTRRVLGIVLGTKKGLQK
jgi:hypothetical protein